MATFTYRFTGLSGEDFPYLPADPPSRRLEPGDTVDCSQEVAHARLELINKSTKTSPSTTAAPPASPAPEA